MSDTAPETAEKTDLFSKFDPLIEQRRVLL